MVLGTSKRHHNNASRPSKHRQKQKRYLKSRVSHAKGENGNDHDSENVAINGNLNDKNDKVQTNIKNFYSAKQQINLC